MTLPIAVLLFGALLLYSGVSNISVTDALGKLLGRTPTGGLGSLSGAPTAPTDTVVGTPGGSAVIPGLSYQHGETDPTPGASGGRLDAGYDGTGRQFVSPFAGTVLLANQSDPGWAGGGYIAIRSDADPNRVYYLAEGISPVVSSQQHVQAGQRIAIPVSNPYNGTPGNFEQGWADPHSPGVPLAHRYGSGTAGARAVVMSFYDWLRSLGGAASSNPGNAGIYP